MRIPAIALALLALAAAPAVAASVTQASGTLYVEGVTPVGALGCYSRAIVELVRDESGFLLSVDFLTGTDVAKGACGSVSQRSGAWASPTRADAATDADGDGRDDAELATFTDDGTKLTVVGDRWEGGVLARASTTLEPGSGTLKVTQSYWYPGFEDTPYHRATGLLSRSDVHQAGQWGKEYAAFGQQTAMGGDWG